MKFADEDSVVSVNAIEIYKGRIGNFCYVRKYIQHRDPSLETDKFKKLIYN